MLLHWNNNSPLLFCKIAKRLFIFFLISVVCCLSIAVATAVAVTNRGKIQLATAIYYGGDGSGDALPSGTHGINLQGNASTAPTATLMVSTIPSVTADELREKIREIIGKIPEFVGIQELSKEYGLKVWLFGGTAASFAHYAKEFLLFERGSGEFYAEYFQENSQGHLDYMDIFRPTQDMDLVVDGPVDKIPAFERTLMERYPHFQGSKEAWEVRPLRENYQDKVALLNNPDFLNQNTDSHSVGLIALNSDIDSDSQGFVENSKFATNLDLAENFKLAKDSDLVRNSDLVKDLFDWDSNHPRFLKDVLAGQLHFYKSPHHKTTSRYMEGKNPEIFSVIRYFIKLFQHELQPSPEDREKILEIIGQAQFETMDHNGYVFRWLEKNTPKLFLHSRNVEHTAQILEETGLKQKLLLVGDPKQEGSPAWWANKEPLRSFELGGSGTGEGTGKTAKELGITKVAHDTKDFFIYSVITRSRKGEPNVLKSRQGVAGEAAAHGEGFYTMANGDQGVGQYTIRFTLAPEARDGSDFMLVDGVSRQGQQSQGILVVFNRRALRVIPESIVVSNLYEYFNILSHLKESDKGPLERLKRKMTYKLTHGTTDKQDIQAAISLLKTENKEHLWKAWFDLPLSVNHPQLLETFIRSEDRAYHTVGVHALAQPHWAKHPEFMEVLIKKGDQDVLRALALSSLSQPHWVEHPEFMEALIKKGGQNVLWNLASSSLSQPHWAKHPEFMEVLIKKGNQQVLWYLAEYSLSQPHWVKHPEFMKALIKKGDQYVLKTLARHSLSQPHWEKHPEFMKALIKKGNQDVLRVLAEYALSQPHWGKHPEFMKALIKKGDQQVLQALAVYSLSQFHWAKHPEFMEALIKKEDQNVLQTLAAHSLSQSHWVEHPYLKNLVQGKKVNLKNLREAIEKQKKDEGHRRSLLGRIGIYFKNQSCHLIIPKRSP